MILDMLAGVGVILLVCGLIDICIDYCEYQHFRWLEYDRVVAGLVYIVMMGSVLLKYWHT